ncbi:MAG: hypothetical protein IJ002_06700 [Clostridia bacterium]|nr:hypothetical protein [Clostridia bacterium]
MKDKIYEYNHKGYCLRQTSYNWHYMIYDSSTGEMVMHVPEKKRLTEAEAIERIEGCIRLGRYLENNNIGEKL